MAKMGKYCKAYPVNRFREYEYWTEKTENLAEVKRKEGDEKALVPRQLTEDDFLYLQENYVVTDGIFIDRNIVFDDVTLDWISFCKERLNFEVPVYDLDQPQETKAQEA
jgi:hypothetical protein